MQEILSDQRVRGAIEAGRGGRVREEQETAAAGSVTQVNDGREAASAGNGASQNGANADGANAAAASTEDGAANAREWIANWRVRQKVAVGSK